MVTLAEQMVGPCRASLLPEEVSTGSFHFFSVHRNLKQRKKKIVHTPFRSNRPDRCFLCMKKGA